MESVENTLPDFFKKLQESLQALDSSFMLVGREIVCEVAPKVLKQTLLMFRDQFQFESLMDIVGVDYSTYGHSEWKTLESTSTGFSRGVQSSSGSQNQSNFRFGCIYLLLSLEHNLRVRLKVLLPAVSSANVVLDPLLDSVVDIYPSANWYEREAFDLFGILFLGHPDLRRILTDYGFIGHPFRKDFPLSGHVEMHYDEALGRVVYAPVEIEPRVLVPRVIRQEGLAGKGA